MIITPETKKKRIGKIIIFILSFLAILLFLYAINVNANVGYDDELGYICSGDEELLISCLGDEELSMFIGNYPSVKGGGGGGGEELNITKPKPKPKEEKKGIDWILIVLIIFSAGLFLVVIFSKRIKKCWFFIIGKKEKDENK